MTSTTPGYGHLYVLDASGKTQVWLENVRLRANQPIFYPRRGMVVRAAPPAGDETIVFVASRRRIAGFGGHATTSTPFDLQLSHEGFRAGLEEKFHGVPRREWAFTEVQIRIQDQ